MCVCVCVCVSLTLYSSYISYHKRSLSLYLLVFIIQQTGDNVAVKIVSTKKIQPDELTSLHTEIGILKLLDHPNIIKYAQAH